MTHALIIIVATIPALIFLWFLIVHGGLIGGYRWHNWIYEKRKGKAFWYEYVWCYFRQWICFKHQWTGGSKRGGGQWYVEPIPKEYSCCYRCGKLEKLSVLEKKWEKEREEKKELEEELKTGETPLIISVLSVFAGVVFVSFILIPVLMYGFFTGKING